MSFWPRTGFTAVGALAGALICSSASAEILAATTTIDAFVSTSVADVAIPLRPNGAKLLRFRTTGPGMTLVKITYNAECVVDDIRGAYVTIRIAVDGLPTNPAAGVDFVFCSAIDDTGSVTGGGTWMAVSRQSIIEVPAGSHIVRVFGHLRAGTGGQWRLDDSSLVVER
jgi:hypothetical protein